MYKQITHYIQRFHDTYTQQFVYIFYLDNMSSLSYFWSGKFFFTGTRNSSALGYLEELNECIPYNMATWKMLQFLDGNKRGGNEAS